ncbi:MAG: hypothetical protein J7641_12660 [Cyanobacteria bacterium SID2]|nr:hypothetical protein [Cyanobacteria bacterium SID2]MBP0002347.1 hypothetical protein [Cyanobacteria bacterium SBC]
MIQAYQSRAIFDCPLKHLDRVSRIAPVRPMVFKTASETPTRQTGAFCRLTLEAGLLI